MVRSRRLRLGLLAAVASVVVTVPGSVLAQTGDDDLRAPAGPEVGLELIAQGFTSPVFLTESPDDSGRLFIVDQAG